MHKMASFEICKMTVVASCNLTVSQEGCQVCKTRPLWTALMSALVVEGLSRAKSSAPSAPILAL
jgi:hypothetical protein